MVRIAMYLPEQTHKYGFCLRAIKTHFAHVYGGYTVSEGHEGGWINDEGDLIEEPVTVIESLTGEEIARTRLDIEALAKNVKKLTEEDTIMFTINHEPVFV